MTTGTAAEAPRQLREMMTEATEPQTPPMRQIRATFDEMTLTVYQAYPPRIAEAVTAAKGFVPPFKRDRMTWIKPSFLWMMYRSGWATKPDQERILAIRITRAGFEQALSHACLSHYDPDVYASHDEWLHHKSVSPVRVQWDPERSLYLEPEPWRSIQIGLSGSAVDDYVDTWVTEISDITASVRMLRDQAKREKGSLPRELPYPLEPGIARKIGASRSEGQL